MKGLSEDDFFGFLCTFCGETNPKGHEGARRIRGLAPAGLGKRKPRTQVIMSAQATTLEEPALPPGEEALIRRVCNGERELFYALVRPYARRIYAAAFAIPRKESDAEDAAQEAVLKAFKNLRQFRGPSWASHFENIRYATLYLGRANSPPSSHAC